MKADKEFEAPDAMSNEVNGFRNGSSCFASLQGNEFPALEMEQGVLGGLGGWLASTTRTRDTPNVPGGIK